VFRILRAWHSASTSSLRAEDHGVYDRDGSRRALRRRRRRAQWRISDEAGDGAAVPPQRLPGSPEVEVAATSVCHRR